MAPVNSSCSQATVSLWRDPDPSVASIEGMGIAQDVPVAGDPVGTAQRYFDRDVRCVRFDQPVDLEADPVEALKALLLIRELTGHGIAVRWTLHGLAEDDWRPLSHLFPPTRLSGPRDSDSAARQWMSRYRICKCYHRLGPGFVQVRDRRFGGLRQHTITAADHLTAVEELLEGSPVDAIPPQVAQDFVRAQLVGRVADRLWWLPYRVRRWPLPSSLA